MTLPIPFIITYKVVVFVLFGQLCPNFEHFNNISN